MALAGFRLSPTLPGGNATRPSSACRAFICHLAKQYQAMDGDLAACRSARRFCNPKKIHGWIFLGKTPPVPAALSFACQAVPSHGWRLSSMQKCKALLLNKCFFGGKFPSTGSGNVVCLLPCAPLCTPLAFSVRTLPELVEGAASPRM